MADDSESIFAKAGFELPGATDNVAAENKGAPSVFEAAGFQIPGAKTAEPASNIPTPERFAEGYAKQGNKNPESKSTLQQIREDIDPAALISTGASNAVHDTLENVAAGWGQVKQAFSNKGGNLLPSLGAPATQEITVQTPFGSYPSQQIAYPNAQPGRLLQGAMGAAGVVGAPISGAVSGMVTRPVTELTGSPDIGERAGLVANALIPVKGTGKIAEAAAPSTGAVNRLVEAIGPENVPEVVAGMRANPRMTPADLSDPVRLTTQGLMAGGTPDVQDLISKSVRSRNDSRLEAANTAYTDAMGPAPNVVTMVEGLKARAREAGQKAIQPAIANAKPVDVSPVIAAIDAEVAPGIAGLKSGLPLSPRQEELWRLRNQLTNPDTGESLFDAARLHQIQSQTGDKAFQLQKSPDGGTRDVGNGLRGINEKLVDAIDAASGGAYRPARAKFKDAKDIHEAFDEGFDVLKNRSGVNGLQDRPEALQEWMKTATPEEVVAKRIGVRADIDQKINGVKNGALAGQNVTAIPYNREKLVTLFGNKEANRLIGVMKDATREAQTSASILAGSKTAETAAAANRIRVREVGGGNPLQYVAPVAAELLGQSAGIPFVGLGASIAGKGIHMGVQKGLQISDRMRNMEFARNALASGPARDATINSLLSHPKVLRELKKRANPLTAPQIP
jgi:hypothetical protein